uniref:G-protein coupled receptors family 1 profile domain-containing protein n=1 Tax=Setaria digitata TaxID=48799 RepID=A0A915PUJ4_9BILA
MFRTRNCCPLSVSDPAIRYATIVKSFCNDTQIYAFHIPVGAAVWPGNQTNPNPNWLKQLISWNTRIHELFVVFIPTIIIIVANVMLILTLKARKKNAFLSLNQITLLKRSSNAIRMKAEQNVTYTVCAIVTCFTLTQAPSGIVSAKLGFLEFKSPKWQRNVMVITNCMVIIGKSLNFLLFCLSSATFRHHFNVLIKDKLGDRVRLKEPERLKISVDGNVQSIMNNRKANQSTIPVNMIITTHPIETSITNRYC